MTKKIILGSVLMFSALAAQAIPLFSFFGDVAGDYSNVQPEIFAAHEIKCMYYQKPSFFSTLSDADSFLNDVMPYTSETIVREEKKLTDKVKMVTYSSPMTTGQTSVIYLIEDPEKGFFAGYDEVSD